MTTWTPWVQQPTDTAPCPTCHLTGGFHDRQIHAAVIVPATLTWSSGEAPRWART